MASNKSKKKSFGAVFHGCLCLRRGHDAQPRFVDGVHYLAFYHKWWALVAWGWSVPLGRLEASHRYPE